MRMNAIVVFNFYCDNIHAEYERIKGLGIEVSELKYVNIFKPYWYFTVHDPNGNEIEITGYWNKSACVFKKREFPSPY